MGAKDFVFKCMGWLFGIALFAITVGMTIVSVSIPALLIGLLVSALCIPTVRDWIYAKSRLKLGGVPLVVGCFALFAIQVTIGTTAIEEADKVAEAKRQDESKNRVQDVRSKTLAEYEANKPSILKDVADKVAAGEVDAARGLIYKYTAVSKDPDLAKARTIVEYEYARVQLKNESALSLEKRVELHRMLANAEGAPPSVVAKAKALEAELTKKVAAERADREKAEALAKNKAIIEAQFSSWDGSHPAVVKMATASMKDPDSFKHSETRYSYVGGDTFMVYMTFRGTNSFGGVVPSTVAARVGLSGQVLTLTNVD